MTTINKIQEIAKILAGDSFSLELNSFKMYNSKRVHFQVELMDQHIQGLLNLGVKFNFSSKIKSSGRNSNEFKIEAFSSAEVLGKLDKYSRENHPNQVSMINNHQILLAGFPLKRLCISEGRVSQAFVVNTPENVKHHVEKIAVIRKEVRKKFGKYTNAYTNRCSVKKIDY